MQGLWKENVSGWNSKNIYRKKTNRKHTLKDKGQYLLKNEKYETNGEYFIEKDVNINKMNIPKEFIVKEFCLEEIIGYKNETIVIEKENKRGRIKKIELQNKLPIKRRFFVKLYLKKSFVVEKDFIISNNYFVEYGTNKVFDFSKLKNKSMEIIYSFDTKFRVPFNFHEEMQKIPNTLIRKIYLGNQKFYLFDKIIPWELNIFYSKRRKIGQKIATRRDRSIIRKWISNQEWEEVIPTHCYSKSISYFVS